MIGLSAKLPGTRTGRAAACAGALGGGVLGAPGAGGTAGRHPLPASATSSTAQQPDRNGLSSRRYIVEPTRRPTALLLFSTAMFGNRAFRNATGGDADMVQQRMRARSGSPAIAVVAAAAVAGCLPTHDLNHGPPGVIA